MNLIEDFDVFLNHSLTHVSHIKPYNIKFYHLILVLKGTCTYVVNNQEIVLEEIASGRAGLVCGKLFERNIIFT